MLEKSLAKLSTVTIASLTRGAALERKVGLESIAQRAINGDFDATKEESDAWYEREGKDILVGLKKANSNETR